MITYKQYEEISILGLEATQEVRGVIRAGHVLNGKFYFPCATNVGILCVDAKDYIATASTYVNPDFTGALA